MSSASRPPRQAGERATTARAIEPEPEAAPPLAATGLSLRETSTAPGGGCDRSAVTIGRAFHAAPSTPVPIVPCRYPKSRITARRLLGRRDVHARSQRGRCGPRSSGTSMRRIHSCESRACAARIRRTRRRSRLNDVELGIGLPSSCPPSTCARAVAFREADSVRRDRCGAARGGGVERHRDLERPGRRQLDVCAV
jgi:hypothetical protein